MGIQLGNVLAVAAAIAAALAFAACGSGDGSSGAGTGSNTRSGAGSGANLSGDTIAQVGDYKVTKAMLNEWMAELIGEEYYGAMSQPAPAHLATEPPDNQACVAALRTVAPTTVTESELTDKCEALYLSMRTQVLEYLVSTVWQANYARAHGLVVSEAEAERGLKAYRERQYPHEADFKRLLATRRRTLAQELFLMKGNLLQRKVLAKARGLGRQAAIAFTAGIGRAQYSVHCRAGYMVEHCVGYQKPSASSSAITPSAQLFEEIARWRPRQ